MGKPQGDPRTFQIRQVVRYKPGNGTYGYEDAIEPDGRIPATVIGLTPQRVRIFFRVNGRAVKRAVDAASLVAVDEPQQELAR